MCIIGSVFKLTGVGIVLSGRVYLEELIKYEKIEISDRLLLGLFNNNFYKITIKSIHNNFKKCEIFGKGKVDV